MQQDLTKKWLILSVTALALSGIFSILLVLGRTTDIFDFLPDQDFFKTSLIIHVNLGILVWLVAGGLTILNIYNSNSSKLALHFAWLGTALITLSPLVFGGEGYFNNYVPMFNNYLFKAGLLIFFLAALWESFVKIKKTESIEVATLIVTILLSAVVLLHAVIKIEEPFGSFSYFENIFWGFGHVLQFTFMQIIMICWIIFAQALLGKELGFRTKKIILGLPVLYAAGSSTYILLANDVATGEYIQNFSYQMVLMGVFAIPPAIIFLASIRLSNFWSIESFGGLCAGILFGIGGVLGMQAAHAMFLSGEITTVIPAHYHGSTLGISIAVMAVFYLMIEKFGFGTLPQKTAKWQLGIYTFGQAVYIICLAILGGHGAQRKTPGVEELEVSQFVIHAMRGAGGLALIGGVMFIVVVVLALRRKPQPSQ